MFLIVSEDNECLWYRNVLAIQVIITVFIIGFGLFVEFVNNNNKKNWSNLTFNNITVKTSLFGLEFKCDEIIIFSGKHTSSYETDKEREKKNPQFLQDSDGISKLC